MEWWYFSVFSALLSAFAAIIEKKILFKEKALSFTIVLAVFNFVLASIFFFFVDFSKISSFTLLVVFFKCILNGLAFLCVMYAIKNLELSDALPLLALTPGFIAIFAFLFLGEKLSLLEIFGLILLIFGSYLFAIRKKGFFESLRSLIRSKGQRYVLVALFLFTLTAILDKIILSRYNLAPAAYMGFQHLFFAIIFILIFVFVGRKFSEVKLTLKDSWPLILILAVATIGYRYFEILAIKQAVSVALAIAIKRTSVFFAVLIGGSLFKESNLLRKIIATLLLVIGAILII